MNPRCCMRVLLYTFLVLVLVNTATAKSTVLKTGKLTSPDDLKDKRIGVLLGTTHEAYAVKNYPEAAILQYKSPSDLILTVKSGKIDAAIYSNDELAEQMRRDDELGFLGDVLFSTPVGAGFHQQNKELLTAFNSFLHKIKSDGTYNDMIRRWMKNGETAMPVLPEVKNSSSITVGLISDNGLPFTVMKNNRLTGFNIELIERFGLFIGKRIHYADLEFGSLIAAAATKKIDMIAAVMGITEERKKKSPFPILTMNWVPVHLPEEKYCSAIWWIAQPGQQPKQFFSGQYNRGVLQ